MTPEQKLEQELSDARLIARDALSRAEELLQSNADTLGLWRRSTAIWYRMTGWLIVMLPLAFLAGFATAVHMFNSIGGK